MRIIINKILHGLSVAIVTIILGLALLLGTLKVVAPYLVQYVPNVEQLVSELVQQPVRIGKIRVSSRGLEPLFKLTDVAILNSNKTKTLIQVAELQVGIDLLKSLLTWRIQAGVLLSRGVELTIMEDKQGELHLFGFKWGANRSTANNETKADEILQWLLEQRKIEFLEVTLVWWLANGEKIKFTDLNLKLNSGVLHHRLKVEGHVAGKQSPANFALDLRLRGELLKHNISAVTGKVFLADWSGPLPSHLRSGSSLVRAGNIKLVVKNSEFNSKFLRTPIALTMLESRVVWHHRKDGLHLQFNQVKGWDRWLALQGKLHFLFPLSTAVVDGDHTATQKNSGVGTVSSRPGEPSRGPIVNIALDFNLTNIAKAKLYYPVGLIPHNAIVWLEQALRASKPLSGTLVLRGPLDKFPFDKQEGEFNVTTALRDVHLAYHHLWPALTNVQGELIFTGRSMTVLVERAKIMQIPVKKIKTTILDLAHPVLHVVGRVDADSSAGLKFLKASPLQATIANKLQTTKLIGPMQLTLDLTIPLSAKVALSKNRVAGEIILHDNYLKPAGLTWGISNLNGNLYFTEDTLISKKLQGRLFARPVQLMVDTLFVDNDTITRVNLEGATTLKNLEQTLGFSLTPYMRGKLNYNIVVDLHTLTPENVVKISSPLQGVTINLPEPFGKRAGQTAPLVMNYYFGHKRSPYLRLDYNNQVAALLDLQKDAEKFWHIVGGEVTFGGSIPKPLRERGVVISGVLKELPWGSWRAYLARLGSKITQQRQLIRQIKLEIGVLPILGQLVKQVGLQITPQDNSWVVMLEAPSIAGKILYPRQGEQRCISGVLQRLYLEPKAGALVTEPRSLLPLHLLIDELHYGEQKFNQVELVTEPKLDGIKLTKVKFRNPYFALSASGEWLQSRGRQHTILRGHVRSANIGSWFQHLKLTNSLVGGRGRAEFSLQWAGAPYEPALAKLGGTFMFQADDGRIVNLSERTETILGLGRILNLLNLRYLSLDFGGLLRKGFSFDTLKGKIELGGRDALLKSLTLKGAIAQVNAYGRIGILAQDYDLYMRVIPYVTASAPVVATLAGGPVVGVLTWVADKIISPLVKQVTTYLYHITGKWEKPQVVRLK